MIGGNIDKFPPKNLNPVKKKHPIGKLAREALFSALCRTYEHSKSLDANRYSRLGYRCFDALLLAVRRA
jgi:hypothetical protein